MNVWNRYKQWLHDPSRHRINWAEVITAGMTVVLATIAYLQLQVYRQQKRIMESSGQQTDQLIVAAETQAHAANRNARSARRMSASAAEQANYAQQIADQTAAQAKATGELARQAARAAESSKAAAETAANQLELSERPWVNADIGIGGPFSFNVNGGNITLKFKLVNSGHSPALGTVLQGIPVDVLFVGSGGKDAEQYRDSVCQGATDMIRRFPSEGVDIFPNASFEQSWTWTFSNEELSKNHGPGTTMPGKMVWPSVVVCIGYRSSFNQTSIYHTAYILDFMKLGTNNQIDATFKIGEDVDQNHLFLRCHPMKCITAD